VYFTVLLGEKQAFFLYKRLIVLKNDAFLSHLYVKIFKTIKNTPEKMLRL